MKDSSEIAESRVDQSDMCAEAIRSAITQEE